LYQVDDVTRANNFEKEALNKKKIYLLKACSKQCIQEFHTFNLLKKESECMNSCFNDYVKLFYDEN